MAKSSRKAKAPQVVEEPPVAEDEAADRQGDSLMSALLVLSFAFIFLGIILAWWTLYQNFDTPFFGVVQKSSNKTVQARAEADFAKATGQAVESESEEGESGEEGGESEPSEEPAEESASEEE